MIRWFLSKTVREAVAFRKHVQRLLNAQRDLMSAEAVAAVQLKINELNAAITAKASNGAVRIKMDELSFTAEEKIKSYPNAVWRENVEVLLVAIAVAMAIRTFFVQPFKIPTGSMQPTLFGVTSEPDFTQFFQQLYWLDESVIKERVAEQIKLRDTMVFPTGWERVKQWFEGISYVHVVAKADGVIDHIGPVQKFLIFNIKQSIRIGGIEHTIWFPPDFGESSIKYRMGLREGSEGGHTYRKGEDVVKLKMRAGDHLFVDRLSYNFRKPDRGEIIVFATKGIEDPRMSQDQFYIKRLVVMPGEHVQIGDDRHVVVDGKRLDASTPHFQNVYSFDPAKPPHESQWSGHVNGVVAQKYQQYPTLAPLFPDGETIYTNCPDRYMVFGDNTCNSFDSRAWGSFPAKNVIGKSFFVYWPITERFGWHNK